MSAPRVRNKYPRPVVCRDGSTGWEVSERQYRLYDPRTVPDTLGSPAMQDAEYLTTIMTLQELRDELRICSYCTHPDAVDFGFQLWRGLALTIAIDLIFMRQPKRRHVTKTNRSNRIDIEVVRNRADILALAEGYGLQLRKSGRNFKTLCPFHNEKTPSFTVYTENNRYHCYGCKADGDAIDFVMRMDGTDFRTAAEKVGG